jgi:TnpA family transposase
VQQRRADPHTILERCEEQRTYAGKNYIPFLPALYRSQRAVLLSFLESVPLRSTTQDRAIEKAIAFVLEYRHLKGPRLDGMRRLDLSWIPERWWRWVTGDPDRKKLITEVDRRYFELCLCTQVLVELKSGDLYVDGSDAFSDYRTQLVSWDQYRRTVAEYGEQVGLPIDGKAFVTRVRTWLETLARATDTSFPTNASVRIEKGEVVLRKLARVAPPAELKPLETLLRERLPEVNVLDILADTDHWIGWTRHFGLLSGYEPKLHSPQDRYITTAFCYGCNLGPSQTARSMTGLDRRQVAWINQRHITEEKLDTAIVQIINAYHRFTLPRLWGSGKHASADGTKWDVYEQNLLAEYHLRYGGWGGIGYYHVSDLYIALFSHFIPCGVWEGVYILDGVANNPSEIQPDTLHADTQGQSAPIFGLAYLLGIQLMPRIRNWQDLQLFRPTKHSRYEHIDELFTGVIDWELIETVLPDLLRVALSIKAGRMTPSTILRRLSTYSRKSRLYFAMRELGRAVRTGFLLQYLSDPELRRTIQRATNKSEAFHSFLKWLFFGGAGVIGENERDAQHKVVKYNHLVANLVIFHNVVTLTKVIRALVAEGYPVSLPALAALSPYQTGHVNRFGHYRLNLDRVPEPVEYELPVLTP